MSNMDMIIQLQPVQLPICANSPSLLTEYCGRVLTEVGMKPVIPEGGYFMMADWSDLADRIDLSSETDPQRDYRSEPGYIMTDKSKGFEK